MPPEADLITGIIGGLVVGLIAGSSLQVSGRAAGLVVLVFELHREHGKAGAGLRKTGHWFWAISPAVVYGMLIGIGVLIMSSQFHVVVDDTPKGSEISNLISIPKTVFDGIFPLDGSAHEVAALIGLLTMGVMLACDKVRPESLKFLPGPPGQPGIAGNAQSGRLDGPEVLSRSCGVGLHRECGDVVKRLGGI